MKFLSRRTVGSGLAGIATLVLVAAGAPDSRADKLPEGKKVIEQFVEEVGGAGAFRRLENRHMSGVFRLASVGLEGSVSIYTADPNLVSMSMEIPGMGTVASGVDGEIAWENQVMTGPRIMEGAEAEVAMRDARFNRELHWEKDYKSAECVEIVDVDGTPCYKVVLTPKGAGNPESWYFGTETRLLHRMEQVVPNAMGEIPTTADLEDYRKVGDILVPHVLRQSMMGQVIELEFDKVEHNVEIPEGRFDLPGDVASLRDAQMKEGAEAGANR